MNASWRLCAVAYCRTKQFEVSPLISGLTPWGHNKKKEQMQTRCLTLPLMRERHHGLKSWDEHGTKGAGQAANQQAEKYKNERHHTYATFLFRNVRQVSHLTGKSNVTNKVHESGKTSCTVQKRREATGLRNHASVKQQTRSESSRHCIIPL